MDVFDHPNTFLLTDFMMNMQIIEHTVDTTFRIHIVRPIY